jgi:hypothetical protein
MAGEATIVCLQQLKVILRLRHFTTKTDVVSVMRSVSQQVDKVNPCHINQLVCKNWICVI